MLLQALLMIFGALLIVIYAHEIGRGGKNIRFNKYFPPVVTSDNKRFRYGGLAVNFAIAYAVYHFKPELFFIQLIGLIAWKHFMYYNLLGLLKEHFPKKINGYSFFNEITRKQIWMAIPLVIGSFLLFREYYIPIAIELFQMIMG